jgi:hypothetical protein
VSALEAPLVPIVQASAQRCPMQNGANSPHLVANRTGLILALLVPLAILATAALVGWLGSQVY